MERKGPHKSMHCKFCKPPGTVAPEKPSPAQLETKTKLHLRHEVADLKVFDVFDEPGEVEEETDACICQLEGYEPCPKCAPDKTRKPVTKKVCDCPLGSKPHPNMAGLDKSNQKKKKKKDRDDEFWWEKYDREHDAMVRETWAAYLAQRKQDKRLAKCREKEGINMTSLMKPKWYQKLSCRQILYLEYLSTAIRLDLDENITDRTSFVLGGIGFYPRPTRTVLQKCLRYCHYNTLSFLNQLSLILKEEDPFKERIPAPNVPLNKQDLYAWNDRIAMACICHLEFPKLLREIMERLPPLPQEKLPPPPIKPKYPKVSIRTYDSPYEEPVWRETMNWVEKQKYEQMKRAREYLEMKRVQIPSLALVKRPSLIDARPPFLSQIEASLDFHTARKQTKKKVRVVRKKEKPTFDSKVDVTAIAGIEASEVSTTPKADSEEICIFMRDRPSESLADEEEEEEGEEEVNVEEEVEETRVEPVLEPRLKYTDRVSTKSVSLPGEDEVLIEEPSDDEDDIPFVTPPKTQSGATIEQPCLPPKSSPGPPASHYDIAKRELGILNEELCIFDPNDEGRDNDDEEGADRRSIENMNVEEQLKKIAQKLKELNLGDEEEEEEQVEKTVEKVVKKFKKKKKKKETWLKAKKSERKKSSEMYREADGFIPNTNNEIWTDMGSQNLEENEEMGVESEMEESSESCVCDRDGEKKSVKKKKSKKRKRVKKKKAKVNPCRKTAEADEVKSTNLTKGEEEEPGEMKPKVTAEAIEAKVLPPAVAEDKTFYGDVVPLLRSILKDLSDEGFASAGYEEIDEHPDIKQLIKHLQGEIVTLKTKKYLHILTRGYWRTLEKKGKVKALPPDLNISQKMIDTATWNDKNWVSKLAKRKKEEFYFSMAKNRANEAKDFYLTLFQEYFGRERFLKAYYAYMVSTREDCIMRGLQ